VNLESKCDRQPRFVYRYCATVTMSSRAGQSHRHTSKHAEDADFELQPQTENAKDMLVQRNCKSSSLG
jgi:hypothetical protein